MEGKIRQRKGDLGKRECTNGNDGYLVWINH